MTTQNSPSRSVPQDLRIPFLIALSQLFIHIIFHGSYGYFRDELYYIACTNHLALGYVDQPPLSIALLAVSRWILGDSLQAIRFLPAVACAGTVFVAALLARRMGGGRFAQGLAAFSVVAAPELLGSGGVYSMNSFDMFFWAITTYVVVRIVMGDSPKLWILFGILVGFGLLNKYSIGFLCIGLVVGLLLSPQRKVLATKWFWAGAAIASLLFLPHILWEIQNGFPSLEFMRNASQQKNVHLSVAAFFAGQLSDVNFLNAPLWLLGIYYFVADREGKRLRVLGWTYSTVFVIMVAGNAKVYYLGPIYPMLLAGGAVLLERIAQPRPRAWIRPVFVSLLTVVAVISAPFALPVLPVNTFIAYQHALGMEPKAQERSGVGVLPQLFADQFGWEDMVAGVAKAYQTLTPEEQSKCVIYMRNYGEAGAIDFFGKQYGLPNALCAHNSYWFWGPGERTGDVAIILGTSKNLQENINDLSRAYEHVELAFTTNCDLCMPYENGRTFFICRGMRTTFQKIWPKERFYI